LFELIVAGGWVMAPLIGCSVLALAITLERLWSLAPGRVVPRHLLAQTWANVKRNELDPKRLKELRQGSPLGEVLAAGLHVARSGRDATREAMQDAAGQVLADLQRFLPVLSVIGAISPLLGLLGTVIGMIELFASVGFDGAGKTAMLASGVSKALITTAGGLFVCIPAIVAHRGLMHRVDRLMLSIEREANRLVELLHGTRDPDRDAIWETVRDALRRSLRDVTQPEANGDGQAGAGIGNGLARDAESRS
jgi:biopolymer transport protein ExbB